MASSKAVPFTLHSLSEAEQRHALALGNAVQAAVMKGFLHRLDPQGFAIDPSFESLEAQAAASAYRLPAAAFERLKPRLQALAEAPSRLNELVGLNLAELRKPGAVAQPLTPKVAPALPPVSSPSKYRVLQLNLRRLHCVSETTPKGGADDMVLGATYVGATGNVGKVKAIVAGEFDDGDSQNYGELPFGRVSLRTTPGYPKVFHWIFQLVESDEDDKVVAEALTAAISSIVGTLVGAFASPAAGVAAGSILSALGGLAQTLIGNDVFPPYGVTIRLNSEGDFGADGWKDEHTDDIRAHGARYRIGYRLRLA